MAKITCPVCDGKSGHTSSGDGWEEWDECRCCNRDGNNDTGKVSARKLAQYLRQEAAEVAHWEKIIAEAEARGELE